ncbi:syncytin-2-like [Bombina bombina]|uniref:syncytin-2-like n=1 Tax=Bombina bombina TaxID=8345 RepID=UPI00235A9170|nr:syncytin-2-like [Bombina bombina]
MLHSRRLRDLHLTSWEKGNTFIKTTVNLYKVTNKTTPCWVCGCSPHGEKWGYPYYGHPLNADDLHHLITSHTMWNFTFSNSSKDLSEKQKVHLVNYANNGSIMSWNHNGSIFYPDTMKTWPPTVLFSYNGGLIDRTRNSISIWDHTYISLYYNKSLTLDPVHKIIYDWYRLTVTEMITFTGATILGNRSLRKNPLCPPTPTLPYGYYWLCEKWAVKMIPCTHLSPCYLGYIIPAIRTHNTLPKDTLRRRRSAAFRDSSASGLTVKTSYNEIWSASWVPSAASIRLYYKLNLFATLTDEAFNYTTDTIESLSMRQEQIAQTTLQIRMALDYLLAAEGCVCAKIGATCCVFITNNTGRIHQDINKLHEVQSKIRKQAHSAFDGFDWLFGFGSWIGSLGMRITGIIIAIIIILLVYLLFKLSVCAINRFTSPNTKSSPHNVQYDQSYMAMLPSTSSFLSTPQYLTIIPSRSPKRTLSIEPPKDSPPSHPSYPLYHTLTLR